MCLCVCTSGYLMSEIQPIMIQLSYGTQVISLEEWLWLLDWCCHVNHIGDLACEKNIPKPRMIQLRYCTPTPFNIISNILDNDCDWVIPVVTIPCSQHIWPTISAGIYGIHSLRENKFENVRSLPYLRHSQNWNINVFSAFT